MQITIEEEEQQEKTTNKKQHPSIDRQFMKQNRRGLSKSVSSFAFWPLCFHFPDPFAGAVLPTPVPDDPGLFVNRYSDVQR